jgi:hypothetical protein
MKSISTLRPHTFHPEKDFGKNAKPNKYLFKEASLFYEKPSSRHAFYHRAVKVKGIIFFFH